MKGFDKYHIGIKRFLQCSKHRIRRVTVAKSFVVDEPQHDISKLRAIGFTSLKVRFPTIFLHR